MAADGTFSRRVEALAARTPADRSRAVDLVRVLALGAVVLGHWLKQGWYVDAAGDLHRAGLLGIATWTHPLTWVFQVIPVFFVVGGFANLRSWRTAQGRAISYGAWLAGRTERLTRPVVPLLLFWVVTTPLAPVLGLEDDWLRIASVTSLVPTWFLATYVVIVALTPLSLAAWDRWGARALLAGLVATSLVDLASIRTGSTAVGALNLLLVYGTLQQVGFAWADGWFSDRRRAVACSLVGLSATMLLVWLGPYGMSMVGVSGHGLNNTYPPRATVLFIGLFLAGGAIAVEARLTRVVAGPRRWRATVALEGRLMTIYLWHLTALGVLGAAALSVGGFGLSAYPNTRDWWLTRPAWLLALAATTVALTLVLGRWEDPTAREAASGTGPLLPLLEVAVASAGLGYLASEGMTRGATSWAVAAATVSGLVVLDRLLCPPRHGAPARR
ncbi:acyltransferase family protein [Nocardioides dilutus]